MELIRNLLSGERDAQPVAMPATFAGRFLVECAVASGEASVVWRATETASGAPVALKFFSPRLVSDPADLAAAHQVIMAGLRISHPRVVAARELVVSEKYAAFVTPWVEGPTLRQMLYARPTRFFEVDDLRRWLRSLVDALEAAHAVGVVHGALTPDVVLQHAGELRLVGFGVNAWLRGQLQRHAHGSLSRDETSVYRSAAQARGDPARSTDDVFGLGVMIYELLAGTPPRGGWWGRHSLPVTMGRQRRKNGDPGETIPIIWERAVRRCLEPRERDRLGSMRELRLRLELGPPGPMPPPITNVVTTPARGKPSPAPTSSPLAAAAPSDSPESVPEPEPAFAAALKPEPVASAPVPPPPAAIPADAPVARPAPQPVRAPSRPPLRGDIPLPVAAPLAGAAAATASAARVSDLGAPMPGALLLRGLVLLVSIVTIAVGGWLAMQVYQRNEKVRQLVADVRSMGADPIEETAPNREPTTPARESAVASEPAVAPLAFEPSPAPPTAPAEVVPDAPVEPVATPPVPESAPPAPEPGVVEVRTDPPGAEVRIAGRPPQHAPCLTEDLAAGSYPVEVHLAGYAPFVTIIDVQAGQRAVVEARLDPLAGGLQVESDPPGAVFVVRPADGGSSQEEGTTPAKLSLPVGRYVVNFRHAGGARSQIVDVDANRAAIARATFPKPTIVAKEAPPTTPSSPPPTENPQPVPAAPVPPPADVASTSSTPTPASTAAVNTAPTVSPPSTPTPSYAARTREPANSPLRSASPATESRALTVMNPPAGVPLPETARPATKPDEPTVAPAAGPPLDGGIFELGSVDVAPRLLERVDPQVPRRRFWGRASARIELVVVIDRMGRVASASVHSTTDESLVAPSLQAVRLWRFSPASKRGQPVPVRVAVPLVFQNS